MMKILRSFYYFVFIKFIVMIVLGINVRHRERLPTAGPAIIVANHNSHLDTMVLITLLSPSLLPLVRPVAAMDYFMRNPLLAWFALNIVGILPIARKKDKKEKVANPLADCSVALNKGEILIFFPEGSRGEPEHLADFKKGIARLAEQHPDIPVYPVFMHGLGKALPRGEAILVPFFCDIFVGEPLLWTGERNDYMNALNHRMQSLSEEGKFPAWE